MKKGLALLLAASMTLSAFSSAALANDLTAEEKFQALVESGIFTGFEDGTSRLDENMTRAQFAAVIARMLDLEANASASSVFSDLVGAEWAAGYIGAAVEAGILEGMGNGTFAPSANVTVEQLATIMVRALDLEVDENATVEGTSDWAQGYVAAAVAAGLISESADYTGPAKRELLVETSYTANDVVNVPAVLEVEATATGAASVDVTFNKAVDSVSVSKSGASVTVADTTFSEDKKSAALEFSSSLSEGTYTVTAKVGDETATATFEITEEIVASIEFDGVATHLNDDALIIDAYEDIFGGATAPANEEAVVIAKMTMLNQYGEDITEDYDINDFEKFRVEDVADGDIRFDADTGLLWLPHEDAATDGEFDTDETINIDLEFVNDDEDETEIRVDVDLEIVDASEVAGIEISDLYHNDEADGTFSFDDSYTDWYLLVEAVDQYGRVIKNEALLDDEIKFDVDNEDIFRVAEVDEGEDGFEIKEIDDVEYTAVSFLNPEDLEDKEAGTTTVTLSANDASAEIEVTVTDEVRVDTIKLSQPNNPVVGAEVVIPFVAIDTDGNEVTDPNVLDVYDGATNDDGGLNEIEVDVSGITVDPDTYALEFRTGADGKAQLVLDLTHPDLVTAAAAEFATDDEIEFDITIETYTENEEEITITIDESQEADGISKVDVDSTYFVGGTDTVKLEHLTFADQGGNEMNMRELFGVAANNANLRVAVETSNASYIALSGGHSVTANVYALNDITDTITLTAGANKGNANVKFTVQEFDDGRWKDVGNASYTVKARVAEMEDFESFVASVPDMVYAATGVDQTNARSADVEVRGVLSNGDKVKLPASQFEASAGNANVKTALVTSTSPTGYKIYALTSLFNDLNQTTEVPVNVVVKGEDGPVVVSATAKISNVAPEITTMELDDLVYSTGEYEVRGNTLYVGATFLDDQADLMTAIVAAIDAEDQYDENFTDSAANYSLVISNYNNDDRETLALVRAGDSFNVTVIADTGKTLAFKVKVAQDNTLGN